MQFEASPFKKVPRCAGPELRGLVPNLIEREEAMNDIIRPPVVVDPMQRNSIVVSVTNAMFTDN
jgi:hypothetical protein